MEMRQLRYFVEICKQRNFSSAAKVFYISPQGIGLAIRRLEEELNRKLFDRTTHGVELTPDAEFLLPRAKQILEILDDCESRLRQENFREKSIRIPFVMGSIEEFAGPVIHEFMDSHIRIDHPECLDFVCEKEVLDGNAEISVTVGPLDEDKFESTWLYHTKNVLVMHENNPLARNKTISVRDLKDVPLVALDPHMRSFQSLLVAARHEGFEPNVVSFVNSVMLLYYNAEMDYAVGLTTRTLYERLRRPNVVAVPFKDPIFDREVYLIKKRGTLLTHYASIFERMMILHSDNGPHPAPQY